MRIPRSIKIGGHTFRILKEHKLEFLGTMHLGSTVIRLNPNQSASQRESTLLHEIIEAINAQQKIGLTEEQICQIESGLYQVLKDNNLPFGH